MLAIDMKSVASGLYHEPEQTRLGGTEDCAATGTGEPVRAKFTSGDAAKAGTVDELDLHGRNDAASSTDARFTGFGGLHGSARRYQDNTGKRKEVYCQTGPDSWVS